MTLLSFPFLPYLSVKQMALEVWLRWIGQVREILPFNGIFPKPFIVNYLNGKLRRAFKARSQISFWNIGTGMKVYLWQGIGHLFEEAMSPFLGGLKSKWPGQVMQHNFQWTKHFKQWARRENFSPEELWQTSNHAEDLCSTFTYPNTSNWWIEIQDYSSNTRQLHLKIRNFNSTFLM